MSNYIRCDDRLVHGQVLFRWLEKLNCQNIIVIDTIVANNIMDKNILKLSLPENVNLHVYSESEICDIEKNPKNNVLIIFKHLYILEKLLKEKIVFESVVIGRISADIGRVNICQNVYLRSDEITLLTKMSESNYQIIRQMSPDDKKIYINDFL